MNILITLPKNLIEKIISGEKKYEMRKCLPKNMKVGEDCMREGIVHEIPFPEFNGPDVFALHVHGKKHSSTWRSPTPRIAFENLIRKMMGKKVWDDNPYVFVYSFKLIK